MLGEDVYAGYGKSDGWVLNHPEYRNPLSRVIPGEQIHTCDSVEKLQLIHRPGRWFWLSSDRMGIVPSGGFDLQELVPYGNNSANSLFHTVLLLHEILIYQR